MALTKSAQKRVRQSAKANERNKHYKTAAKTAIKKVLTAETKAQAEPLMKDAISIIDKVTAKKVFHKNKASNQKSRITKHVN